MSKILGLVGYAGAGKDTVADHLLDCFPGLVRVSFAGKLKEIISGIFDVPLAHFEDRKLKNAGHPNFSKWFLIKKFGSMEEFSSYLIPVLMELYDKNVSEVLTEGLDDNVAYAIYHWIEEGCSPRRACQIIGTDILREKIDQSTWLNYAERQIKKVLAEGGSVAISDVRFPNEFELVRRMGGGAWYINRPDVETHEHISESFFAEMRKECDLELNNDGTIDQLKADADQAYVKYFSFPLAA